MPELFLKGERIRLQPKQSIGKGGEADIYDLGNGQALKLFKPPTHPDLVGDTLAQKAARARLDEHQQKLLAFPKGLPAHVVVPQALVLDAGDKVVGYVMPLVSGAEVLLKYGQRPFRQHVPQPVMIQILRDLHATVGLTHAAKVVIGDFNDLNVLVRGFEAYVIDADSMQFGNFPCRVYTNRFVDPLLCDPKASNVILMKPHTPQSDWYAFAIMAMQSLLYVDPYGGIYRPKDPGQAIGHQARPLRRITVFHPDVRYPKPAVPYGMLPDEWLDYFQRVFERDERGIFPERLLENLRWTKCSVCQTEHARAHCPNCATVAPAAIKQTVVIRGTVTATRLYKTSGVILNAEVRNGKLCWLAYEGGSFKREDGTTVIQGTLESDMHVWLEADATYIGRHNVVMRLAPGKAPERLDVDVHHGYFPVFATSGERAHWVSGDFLYRKGSLGTETVGEVLAHQTVIWTGSRLGFGFYRAGSVRRGFVFSTSSGSLNDSVKLPALNGNLVEAHAVLANDRCWFFTTTEEAGMLINRCTLVKSDGSTIGNAQATRGDGSWLGSIHGGTAVSDFLLMPTDEGIVRVEADGSELVVTKTFPDTEPFIDTESKLHVTKDGLLAVTRQEIVQLRIV